MLIWDYIRDFLVQYIFGGYDSSSVFYSPTIGKFYGDYDDIGGTGHLIYSIGAVDPDGASVSLSIGDWLATTTTIVIMCLIVVLFALLVRWVFKTVVSAFLLR